MDAIFARHSRIVLQFSGGKDSLAILELCRPYWAQLTVLWLNTGAALPETVQQMAKIRQQVPHFLEVRTDQPTQIDAFGYPSDTVPMAHTELGRLVEGHAKPLLQPYYQCCSANIWQPMHGAVQALGATLVIRGQRNAEAKKSPVRNGDVIDGIEYYFPIEDWGFSDVVDFLKAHEVPLPAHYAEFDSSLDCWSCTAYLSENVGKLGYLERHHPEKAEQVRQRIYLIHDALHHEQQQLKQFLGGRHV